MKVQKIIIAAMSIALVSLATIGGLLYYANRPPTLGGNFSAVHESGPWNFNDDPKTVNILYVGYAKCPDVCPMALAYTKEAFSKLTPGELTETRFLFVSVDIENDTAASTAQYARQFNPNFIGLIGSIEQINQIMKLFGASYIMEPDPKSYLGYSISHSDRLFFLNKKGRVIDSLASPRDSESIVQKIKENL